METRYYRAWRFNRETGLIEGIHELAADLRPHVHCCLLSDNGRLVRLEEYRDRSGRPFFKILGYGFGRDPRIMEALDYNPDGTLRMGHKYIYDGDGPMVDRIEFSGEGTPRGHVTSRWENGHEVEETAWDADNQMRNRHVYGYDAAGNLTREQIYEPDGSLQGTRELDYDAAGNVIEKRWYAPDGTLQSRFVHQFSADNDLLATTLYDGEGVKLGALAPS